MKRMIKELNKWSWERVAFIFLFTLSTLTSFTADIPDLKKEKPHVVFLVNEDPNNYEATRTIPAFAELLKKEHGFKTTVLVGTGEHGAFRFPGLEVLSDADLLVVFCRRVALTHEQLGILADYLGSGGPVVGIRTANHAFNALGEISPGHEAWPGFVTDILGCENRGYGPEPLGTEVTILPSEKKHPVLRGVEPVQWHAEGSTYLVAPLLDTKATVLMTGTVTDKVEPITWTRHTSDNSRVFYTSLGYPSDFDKPQFRKLLTNGIYWALNRRKR